MQEQDFWQQKEANKINQKLNHLIKDQQITEEATVLMELFDPEDDNLVAEVQKFVDSHYIKTLFADPSDNSNVLFELKISSGGTEALDFTKMLFNMYSAFFRKKGFETKIIYVNEEHPGIKDIIIEVYGQYAYGTLKLEEGVHRLIRISPFDAAGKRHTTFVNCHVTPLKVENSEIVIKTQDLEIQTFRSSGAGGQSVNTTDSAVRIKHIPTNIVVTCQNERSQLQNKERALVILKNKLALKQAKDNERESKILGAWGNQIKTYTLHPYSMYKDHRFNIEDSNVLKILDGNLEKVITESIIEYNKLKGNKDDSI